MHASYQIIIQVLQLAYTTQACISNLKNLCNASKHMTTMHISNATNQSSWACSPYLCASLVQEFWSFSILQCCSLFIHVQLLLLPMMHLHIFVPTSPPLSLIFIKGVLLIDTKDCIGVDGWHLNLVFLMDNTTYVGMTPHVGSLTLIPIGGAPPLCHSMGHPFDKLDLLYVRELASLADHLKLRITCGTTIWYARYHLYEWYL